MHRNLGTHISKAVCSRPLWNQLACFMGVDGSVASLVAGKVDDHGQMAARSGLATRSFKHSKSSLHETKWHCLGPVHTLPEHWQRHVQRLL